MKVLNKTRLLIVSYLLTVVIAFPSVLARAGQSSESAQFPDTTLGNLAKGLIEVFGADQAAQRSFITSNFDAHALNDASEARWLNSMKYIREHTGGFDVTSVNVVNPGEIHLTLHSRNGNYWIAFITRLSQSDPQKLDGYGFHVQESPEVEKEYAWPTSKLDDAGIAREIERHAKHAAEIDSFSGSVMVEKGDRVIYSGAFGYGDKSFKAPNRIDTKFNLGSMNKMFTSVAIAQLVEAGKLSYDDTLAKVLPDYPNKETAAKITVAELLSHTSGLGDFFKPEFFRDREKYVKLQSYFPIFANDPLLFEPGTKWSYSNAGFIVLGVIVEKVSGQDYFDYVREHIFKPAGMNDTDSYGIGEVAPNLAIGYTRAESYDPLGIGPREMNWQTLPLKGSSAGGGYSTAPDLMKFVKALRSGKLISPKLVEEITTGKREMGPGMRYAYGFGDETINGKSVRGHNGGAPGINSSLQFFWDGSYTVVVMGNYDPPAAQSLSEKITDFLAHQ